MRKRFEEIDEQNILKVTENENSLTISIPLSESFPADKMKLSINDNQRFKIELREGKEYLLLSGGQSRNLLGISATIRHKNLQKTKDSEESSYKSQSSSRQWTISGKLDFKELKAEHDLETESLIVSIPKVPDPNNKSITMTIPKRKKKF